LLLINMIMLWMWHRHTLWEHALCAAWTAVQHCGGGFATQVRKQMKV